MRRLLAILILLVFALPAYAIEGDTTPSLLTTVGMVEAINDYFVTQPVDYVRLYNTALKQLSEGAHIKVNYLPKGLTILEADVAYTREFRRVTAHWSQDGVNSEDESLANLVALAMKEDHTYYIYQKDLGVFHGQQVAFGIQTAEFLDAQGNPQTVIEDVLENSPAAKAGLRISDEIVAFDGQTVLGKSMYDSDKVIHGDLKPGWHMFTVRRRGQLIDIKVNREEIQEPAVAETNVGCVAWIKVRSFMKGAVGDIIGLTPPSACAIILDLRSDPGGYIVVGEEVFGLLYGKGIEGYRTDQDGTTTLDSVPIGPDFFRKVPLVVLVNSSSASASEMIAVSLRHYHRAKIIGVTTAGALAEGVTIQLSLGMVSVTDAWLTGPGGEIVNHIGVTPDIRAVWRWQDVQDGVDSYVCVALKSLSEQVTIGTCP